MDTAEEYRVKIRKIADLAFGNVVNSPNLKNLHTIHPKDWTKNSQKKFIIKVHEGFKKAQNLLIEEIFIYQILVRGKKKNLKNFRRKQNKESQQKTDAEIQVINQRLSILSHIADGIAWQLIGGEIHIARRFHIEKNSSKFLDSSNIEHSKKVADEINKSPLDFALISDLTSFVQIGDILLKHGDLVGIMELKEGKVNDQIKEFIDGLEKNNQQVTDELLNKKFDKKIVKQAKRMQRQNLRAKQIVEISNKDKGTDPALKIPIKIHTPTIQTEYYQKEFTKLNKALDTKIWAYTVIENCLHVGMYRDKGIIMSEFVIKEILQRETSNFIIIDWFSITNNLSQPLFAKPLSPNLIVDILTRKIKVILGLNLDVLIELFNTLGIKTKWLSTKDTAKIKQKMTKKGVVVINDRAISMNLPNFGEEVILSGGIISKILYDNILPSNIALSILSTTFEKE